MLGDRVFFITDNAHLICLQRLTGALLWEVSLGESRYGGTSPPLIAGDLVIAGVSGGDEAIRGLIAAYNASTGEQAWRFWTVPRAGEPGSETWKDDPQPQGGTTWTAGSYDAAKPAFFIGASAILIRIPMAITVAVTIFTPRVTWRSMRARESFSGISNFTPHDLHDWDANQPLVLVDAPFHGRERKLLLHANRNGFFYVL